MQIKELRKLMGVKQGALARDMGVSQPTVSDWESGKMNPTIDNLIFLSRYFSVSVGCVIGTEPIPDGYPDHVAPVSYQGIVNPTQKAAEKPRDFKPTKKPPFTQEQTAYLEDWGQQLKKDVADEVVQRLREDTSLLRETGTKEE